MHEITPKKGKDASNFKTIRIPGDVYGQAKVMWQMNQRLLLIVMKKVDKGFIKIYDMEDGSLVEHTSQENIFESSVMPVFFGDYLYLKEDSKYTSSEHSKKVSLV